jgi:hypothetical protein
MHEFSSALTCLLRMLFDMLWQLRSQWLHAPSCWQGQRRGIGSLLATVASAAQARSLKRVGSANNLAPPTMANSSHLSRSLPPSPQHSPAGSRKVMIKSVKPSLHCCRYTACTYSTYFLLLICDNVMICLNLSVISVALWPLCSQSHNMLLCKQWA